MRLSETESTNSTLCVCVLWGMEGHCICICVMGRSSGGGGVNDLCVHVIAFYNSSCELCNQQLINFEYLNNHRQ